MPAGDAACRHVAEGYFLLFPLGKFAAIQLDGRAGVDRQIEVAAALRRALGRALGGRGLGGVELGFRQFEGRRPAGRRGVPFHLGAFLGLSRFLGGTQLRVQIDLLGKEGVLRLQLTRPAPASGLRFDANVAVGARLGGLAAQGVDLVLAVWNDLDVAVGLRFHRHEPHAAVRLRPFAADARLGGRLGHLDVAVRCNLEGDIAAVRHQADVAIAARLGGRRLGWRTLGTAPGTASGPTFRPALGIGLAAGLGRAAGRLGKDLLANLHLVAAVAECKVENARVAAFRLAPRRVLFADGRLAQLQIGVAAQPLAPRQLLDVLRSEAPGAAVGKGPHFAALGHLA